MTTTPLPARPRVVVLGAGAAGLTAALSLKALAGSCVDVVVVSRSDRFVLAPALVRLPFDAHEPEDVSFRVAPVLQRGGVHLLHEAVVELDVRAHVVVTDDGAALGRTLPYDHLVVATGRGADLTGIPGAAEHAVRVTDLAAVRQARRRWRDLLREPADLVVTAHAEADCPCPAAEVALVAAQRMREVATGTRVRLVTGRTWRPAHDTLLPLLERAGVDVVDAEVLSVGPHEVRTTTGSVSSGLTVVVPPLVGRPVVARAHGLAGRDGLVPVRPTFQSVTDDDVYAVGAASDLRLPWRSTSSLHDGLPWSPAEASGRAAGEHLARRLRAGLPRPAAGPPETGACVLDGGDAGTLSVTHDGPVCEVVHVGPPVAEGTRVALSGSTLWRARSGLLGRGSSERLPRR